MDTKMTRAEKVVAGIAVAVLVAGFATGVLAKPLPLRSLQSQSQPSGMQVPARV